MAGVPAVSSASARGNPDWQGTIATEDFYLLRAYSDPGLRFALPRAARLARRADGSPWFFLEFISDRNGAKPEESLYAMIDVGLNRESDLSSALGLLSRAQPGVTLMPATFTTGNYWHLECVDVHATAPFHWEDAQRATIHGRLPAKTAQVLYSALGAGSITVARAAVECEMAAFLPRVDTAATFSAQSMLSSVKSLNPAASSVPFRRMVSFFDDPPRGLFRFDDDDKASTGIGLALAGRVRRFFGKAAPCPRIADGPHVALDLPSGTPDLTTWDLRTPLMTGTPVFLDFDPFTSIVNGAQRDSVTAFTRVPVLPEDLRTQQVTVASGIPRNIRNCDGIDLTLKVDKQYSRSGSTAVEPVPLYPDFTRRDPVELKFGKIGPKPYSTRVSVVIDGEPAEMPWVDALGDYQYIGTDRLPGSCVSVFATPDLLAHATVSVAITGSSGLTATLEYDEPTASFLLPADDAKARLAVTANDLGKIGGPLTLDLPVRSVTLDLASFREYGPKTAKVTVQFHDGAESARLEFQPESGDDTVVLGFSPANSSGEFSYFPTNPFRNRYRFRQASETPENEADWSPFRSPERDLNIAVYRDGARVADAPGEERGNRRG